MAINTVINTNMMALTAHRNLGTVGNRQNKANQRLSSGKKINSAADDAAGLAISEKMKAQIRGLDMASKNSEDAISLIQTAEGSLTEVNNMLTRVRELTVQAANDTNQKEDRVKIAEEVAQLLTEIDSIADRTEFNEKKLNDGSFQDGHFQIGANGGQSLDLSIGNMNVKGIGLDGVMDVFGVEGGDKKGAPVKATLRADDGTIVANKDNAATKQSIEINLTVSGSGNSKDGNLTLTYKDKDGKTKIETIEYKTDATAGQNKLDKTSLEAALSKTELGKDFDFKLDANGTKLTMTAKKAGASNFELISVSGTENGQANKGVSVGVGAIKNTAGQDKHTAVDVTDVKAGYSLTVAGKKINFVATADDIIDPNTDVAVDDDEAARAQIEELLRKEGLTWEGGPNADEVIFKKITKGYLVNGDTVSDNGSDYSDALKTIDSALKNVTTQRAKLGANQNRLEYTIKNLELSSENLNAARSRIEDTDMAKEMMNLTQANVLQQAATSILAQANQAPNNITQLLG